MGVKDEPPALLNILANKMCNGRPLVGVAVNPVGEQKVQIDLGSVYPGEDAPGAGQMLEGSFGSDRYVSVWICEVPGRAAGQAHHFLHTFFDIVLKFIERDPPAGAVLESLCTQLVTFLKQRMQIVQHADLTESIVSIHESRGRVVRAASSMIFQYPTGNEVCTAGKIVEAEGHNRPAVAQRDCALVQGAQHFPVGRAEK